MLMNFDPLMILVATQIIVESLPISSSGHMMLAAALCTYFGLSIQAMPEFFDHFLHGPTLLVIALYFHKAWLTPLRMLMTVLQAWLHNRFSYTALRDSHKRVLAMFVYIAGLVIVADGVTACCYLLMHLLTKHTDVVSSMPMLTCGFALTGLVLLSCRFFPTRKNNVQAARITFPTALILGLVQGLALFPGISRFGCTVVAAQWLGISPRRALQFSFLVFFPLITAAFFINGIPALLHHPEGALFMQPAWLLICLLSTVVAYALFALACRMVLRKQLWWFGVYMAIPVLLAML